MAEYELLDYQVLNAGKVAGLIEKYHIAYLAAEVRTRKTGTVLYAAQLLFKKKVLFVTKKNAISSIENDYRKYGFDKHFDMTVINHESLKNISKLEPFDLVIGDENHAVSAYPKPALRWTVMREFCKGKDIILLTGTPNPESYSQLYHQFQLSDWSPWVEHINFYKWCRAGYVDVRKKYVFNRELNDYSHGNKDKILKDVGHLMIRFSQEQAGFTKKVREVIEFVSMKESTYKLVSVLKRDKVYESADKVILADTAVKMQSKLHQIFSGTVKTEGGEYIIFDTSKIDYIKEKYAGKKIAIFYKFIAEGEMIRSQFEKTTQDPFEFNASGPEVVFYRQYQSGREGINLSAADYILFVNLDFSAISYLQSKERMMALDREKEAVAVYLFAMNGMEEFIWRRLQNKKNYTLAYFMRDFGFQKGEFKEYA